MSRTASRLMFSSAAAIVLMAAQSASAAVVVPVGAAASSQYSGYEAKYAIDSGTNTDWAAGSTGAGTRLDLALGGYYRVSGAKVVDRVTSGGGNGSFVGGAFDYTSKFSLQGVTDLGGSATSPASSFAFGGGQLVRNVTLPAVTTTHMRYTVEQAAGVNPGVESIAFDAVPLQNLLTNGDFEQGDVGFGSDYTTGSLYLPAIYAVGANPNSFHGSWASFGDHTSGAGKMLILNGSLTPGQTFWRQTVSVRPGRTYGFNAFVASTYPVSPARLSLLINDQLVGEFGPSGVGVWTPTAFSWNSGAAGSATLRLVDGNGDWTGNDFAVDDLRFGGGVPEPATWAMMILGFGAAGAMIRRRRLAAA